jgi:hypothetical protein
MTLSTILEVVLGLIVFFYILSLIVQAVTGKIDEWMAYRAKDLEEVLRDMLTSADNASEVDKLALSFQKLKNNPLIQNLVPRPPAWSVRPQSNVQDTVKHSLQNLNNTDKPDDDNAQLPDRIPAKTFALALFNTLVPENKDEGNIEEVREAVELLPDGETKTALLALIDASNKSIKDAREKVEDWFNDGMTRVSALYRVHTRRISFVIALILVVLVDADTIAVTQRLWDEPALRAAISAEAQMIIDNGGSTADVTARLEDLNALDFPVFILWQNNNWQDINNWLHRLPGWTITWFALSLGASFWYDMMKRLKGESAPPATT